jgi:hypothetical protein
MSWRLLWLQTWLPSVWLSGRAFVHSHLTLMLETLLHVQEHLHHWPLEALHLNHMNPPRLLHPNPPIPHFTISYMTLPCVCVWCTCGLPHQHTNLSSFLWWSNDIRCFNLHNQVSINTKLISAHMLVFVFVFVWRSPNPVLLSSSAVLLSLMLLVTYAFA